MKTDRIVQYIENNYGIKVADYKVVPRLMFRESLRIKSNECQYVVKKYPLATDSACLADMVELYAELERCGVTTNKVLRSEAGRLFLSCRTGNMSFLRSFLELQLMQEW